MSDNTTYELVDSPTPGELAQAVSERINRGWWPLGTPFVHGERYVQAMIGDQFADQPLWEIPEDE